MSATVWQAVKDLAAVWRSSPFVQEYAATASGIDVSNLVASALHVQAQPLLLSEYLHTTMGFEEFHQSTGSEAWLEHGGQIAHGYITMIEWLRSRLTGYPFPEAPQLRLNSPWTTLNVSMRTPWFPQLHAWELHKRGTPPTMPFLSIDRNTQLTAVGALATALQFSPHATRLDTAWRTLHDSDRHQLTGACAALDRAVYTVPEGQNTGEADFQSVGWSEAELDAVVRPLNGPAKTFVDALTDAERLIQQIAALFSQLVIYNSIRVIDNVVLVEQLLGHNGWHTVRTNTYLFPHVRQFEIVKFDHPYPRGLLLVEGLNERIGRRQSEINLFGRLLPDSEDIVLTYVQDLPRETASADLAGPP